MFPVEQEQQKRWGEVSVTGRIRATIRKIKQEYQSGISINCLAEKSSLYAVRKFKSKVRRLPSAS